MTNIFPKFILCDISYLTVFNIHFFADENLFLESFSHYRYHIANKKKLFILVFGQIFTNQKKFQSQF